LLIFGSDLFFAEGLEREVNVEMTDEISFSAPGRWGARGGAAAMECAQAKMNSGSPPAL
jgi:hypothetical protein